VSEDEGVRLGVTMGHLAKLPTVFKKDGSTTPGNASQLSDGAAAVILMKRAEAMERGLVPMAALRSFAVAGVDPAVMGIGPVIAIPRALEKAGLTINDIDLFEINEAFGSQADYCIEKLGLNRDVVNVMGGAIALGHPLGMTGARLTVSIIHELHRRGGRYGVVSMCIGTGMGAAAVYEINSDASVSAKL
jgi:acetyl-CoA acetyltransferase family protein